MAKKIGLFGGSFNPPHKAHINLIKSILKEKLVDEVWVFSNRSHFRKNLIPLRHREKMLQIALAPIRSSKVKFVSNASMPFDVSNPSSLYIYRQYKKYFPDKKFYLIGGSDLLLETKDWEGGGKVEDVIKFLIVLRTGYPIKFKRPDWLYFLKDVKPHCSSTQIRKMLQEGLSVKKFIIPKVEQYIKKNKLYFNKKGGAT